MVCELYLALDINLMLSMCVKTQMSRIEADRAAIVAEWNAAGRPAGLIRGAPKVYNDYNVGTLSPGPKGVRS